jgi:hypothetical protein
MNIFTQGNYMSPSEFKYNHNALIVRAIGRELVEVCEFYYMLPENENLWLAPSIPQISVTSTSHFSPAMTTTSYFCTPPLWIPHPL